MIQWQGTPRQKALSTAKAMAAPELLLSQTPEIALKGILGCTSARCLPPRQHPCSLLYPLRRKTSLSSGLEHSSAADLSLTRSTRYHCVGKEWEDALLAAISHQMNSAARNCTTSCEILILLKHKAAYQRTYVLDSTSCQPLLSDSKEAQDHD